MEYLYVDNVAELSGIKNAYVATVSKKIYETIHTHPQLIQLIATMRKHTSLVDVPWLNDTNKDLYYTRSLDNQYFNVSIYPDTPSFSLSYASGILVSIDILAIKQDIFFPKISLFEI